MNSKIPIWTMVIVVLGSVYADDSTARLVPSRLNALELQRVKYQIEINKPSPMGALQQPPDHEAVSLRASNGVLYQCSVPSFGGGVDEDDESSNGDSSSVLSSMMRQYNFTEIQAKVKRTTSFLKTENVCIYKNLGWWTYEFCFGKLASQFHIQANGSVLGEKISLGAFQTETNWSDPATINSSPTNEAFYHEQHFEDGSICELNQKPRRMVAKIFCRDNSAYHIDEIVEIESCVYEFKIHSSLFCDISGFRKAVANFDVSCSPMLDQTRYEKYLQLEIQKLEQKRIEMKQRALDHQRYMKQFQMVDPKFREADMVRLYEDNSLKSINEKTRALFAEQEKTLVYDDEEDDDDVRGEEETEDEPKPPAKTQDDKLKSVLESEAVIDKLSETLTDLLDGLDTEDLETTTISVVTDEITDDHHGEPVQQPETDAKPDDGQTDEEGDIERLLIERLAKSNKLIAEHLKENRIKVKILTLDSDKEASKSRVDDEDADGLASVITRLIETDRLIGKQKESQSNYETDYNNLNSVVSNDHTNQNDHSNYFNDEQDDLIVF